MVLVSEIKKRLIPFDKYQTLNLLNDSMMYDQN